jgi:hypothetical protein
MATTFDPTVGSPSNLYRSFPDAVFLGLDLEWPLGQVEVASLEIGFRI